MKKIGTIIFIFGVLTTAAVYNSNHFPETVTMLLSGSGLIGIAAVVRKRFLKRNKRT
jgi:hypothetical protein